jgi:hypothetical protein
MTPTNYQIFREAVRRREAVPIEQRLPVQDYVIEVVRENWAPPDPDLLAYREWMSTAAGTPGYREEVLAGKWDRRASALAYLAGARMAREQEQEQANHPVAFTVRVMAGVFNSLDHAKREARAALDKHRGEA